VLNSLLGGIFTVPMVTWVPMEAKLSTSTVLIPRKGHCVVSGGLMGVGILVNSPLVQFLDLYCESQFIIRINLRRINSYYPNAQETDL
jgi:hypothetical protein